MTFKQEWGPISSISFRTGKLIMMAQCKTAIAQVYSHRAVNLGGSVNLGMDAPETFLLLQFSAQIKFINIYRVLCLNQSRDVAS